MEGDYTFQPKDWNYDKEVAVIEVNGFMNSYLSDLNLRSISISFMDIVDREELVYLSGYTSVKTWIKFWEYYSTCDSIKVSKATTNPDFPPDFPPLDYYTLNKIVFHYLLDVKLVEEARTFALHTSDDNPDGIDYVDYTVVESVRKFIVPFTAYISEYSPNSITGKTFLFPSLIEQPGPPKPVQSKLLLTPPLPNGNSPKLPPYLDDQLIDLDLKKVIEKCQPQLQLPRPEAPESFLNMDPQLERILSWIQGSNYMPQQGVPSSLSLTGGIKLPDFTEQRKPPPLPPTPPQPEGKPPRSFPYLDQLINVNVKSLLPTELVCIPQRVVPSSYSSLMLTGEHKPPEVTKQRKPPPLLPNRPQPKGKPQRRRPPPFLNQLINANVKSFVATELDFTPLPVEKISSDSLLTLTEPTQQLLESQLPQLCPQPKSSLGLTENYSTSDFDEHLPPSKIRREQSEDN